MFYYRECMKRIVKESTCHCVMNGIKVKINHSRFDKEWLPDPTLKSGGLYYVTG